MLSDRPVFLVDYNRVGPPRIKVGLWAQHRGVVNVGDEVNVSGDDVPDRVAVVESISQDGRYATLLLKEKE